MALNLLAVDDSVTMRKVLEITFAGEDFSVVTADCHKAALEHATHAQVCVIDTVLGDEDGYALAKAIRKVNPTAAVVMLSSRYAPYDATRGREAGADDHLDKPFDTQQLIDKVRKVLSQKASRGVLDTPPPGASAGPVSTARLAAHARISETMGTAASDFDRLGLSAEQSQAVLASTREIIERVVWEVVPQLAETLIKEEIARLLNESPR